MVRYGTTKDRLSFEIPFKLDPRRPTSRKLTRSSLRVLSRCPPQPQQSSSENTTSLSTPIEDVTLWTPGGGGVDGVVERCAVLAGAEICGDGVGPGDSNALVRTS